MIFPHFFIVFWNIWIKAFFQKIIPSALQWTAPISLNYTHLCAHYPKQKYFKRNLALLSATISGLLLPSVYYPFYSCYTGIQHSHSPPDRRNTDCCQVKIIYPFIKWWHKYVPFPAYKYSIPLLAKLSIHNWQHPCQVLLFIYWITNLYDFFKQTNFFQSCVIIFADIGK